MTYCRQVLMRLMMMLSIKSIYSGLKMLHNNVAYIICN